MAEKQNPLDSFAGQAKNGQNDVRLRDFPKLSTFIAEHGLTQGVSKFDEAMEETRQHHERVLNEFLQGRPPVSGSKLQ